MNTSCTQYFSYKTGKIPHKCYFKAGDAKNIKNKEYSNFLHTYCDADHARDISHRRLVTSTVHLFNVTPIDWCARKKSETPRIISNAETRAIYTGVLDQKCIREFFRSIGYTIWPSSKLYEDNQATIKRVMADRITLKARPIGVLITDLHELHIFLNM